MVKTGGRVLLASEAGDADKHPIMHRMVPHNRFMTKMFMHKLRNPGLAQYLA